MWKPTNHMTKPKFSPRSVWSHSTHSLHGTSFLSAVYKELYLFRFGFDCLIIFSKSQRFGPSLPGWFGKRALFVWMSAWDSVCSWLVSTACLAHSATTCAVCWHCFPKTIDNSDQKVALPALRQPRVPRKLLNTIVFYCLTLQTGLKLVRKEKEKKNI